MKLIREFDDFDWARGPANLYVGQCIKDMMDPSNTEWVVEKIGTTFGDREVVYVSDGEETIMLDRKIVEEDLNNGRYVSCDNNFITESDDEWDWARGSVINPWLEYDGIIFDIEPRRDEVNRYIEMALKTIDDIVNKDQWRIGRENDITDIINYQKELNHCILALDKKNSLSYSSDDNYFRNRNLIRYSQLIGMEPLMESDEWDWAREIPSNPLHWHKPKINLDNVERDLDGYPLQQGIGEGEIWVDVAGLTQDQKIMVLKNIESIIGELRFENTLTTIKSIEGNKNRDYCLGNNIKGYILHCGHEDYNFFSQENHVCCMSMGYQTFHKEADEVQIYMPRINGRDLIKIA
jgi:hypothetical protein